MTYTEARDSASASSIYQHPLAYLLGLHGVALMHAYSGEHDRDFTWARIAEIRHLLDRQEQLGEGWEVQPLPAEVGYDEWAPTYDGATPSSRWTRAPCCPSWTRSRPGKPSTWPAGLVDTRRT